MTLSHTLVSLEKSGLVGKQGDCTSLGWFDLMALPDVHMKPTVPTPGESVGVCSMATCFQNARFNMKKVAMPILPPMKWLTKPYSTHVTVVTFSPCVEGCSRVQSVEWKNVPLCTGCLRESSGGVTGSCTVGSFALDVLICCHRTW